MQGKRKGLKLGSSGKEEAQLWLMGEDEAGWQEQASEAAMGSRMGTESMGKGPWLGLQASSDRQRKKNSGNQWWSLWGAPGETADCGHLFLEPDLDSEPSGILQEGWRAAAGQRLTCAFPSPIGATAGTIDTKRNISAEEGGSVILQCHFSSDTAEVTQVDWKQQDQLLAIYSVDLGWHVASVFSDRVVPGPSLGLTFQSLTMNDTGEYFCTYHTYPGGIYKGRIFLKVQESSGMSFEARW
jgi:hypothetical protein